MNATPSREAFLHAPIDQVAAVAPATVVLSLGGTRRGAALAGLDPRGDTYPEWMRQTMHSCLEALFTHGVQHIFITAIIPANLVEFASFRARFLQWFMDGIAAPAVRDEYAQRGWRARIVGAESIPELRGFAGAVNGGAPPNYHHTVWWMVAGDPDAPFRAIAETVRQPGVQTRADAIRRYYGEDVPQATLFIAFGKPIIAPELLPPFLADRLECYWTQQPGHRLDISTIRRIFYDYAYLRPTGSGTDRQARYADVLAQRALWEAPTVLGLGRRVGGFWYPEIGSDDN